MMFDIFSSFDPMTFNSILPTTLFLIMNLIILLTIHSSYWSIQTRFMSPMTVLWYMMEQQLSRTLSINIKGLTNMVSTMFILIIMINLMGLIPYTFSTSSHLLFTMSLGMPFWLMLIISSLMFWPKMFIAHFLPDGAPDWLNPFLVLIETTSVGVRPITLSFRLAANMSAGHIVLGLVGIYSAASIFSSMLVTMLLLSIGLLYIIFELAICSIQGYIFCLLLSLYANEHTH